jgi:hypothetical protein
LEPQKPEAEQPKDAGSTPMPNSSPLPCDEIWALLPAFAIGATDESEEALIKASLADCPGAAEELAEHMKMAEAMLYSAPPLMAPAQLEHTLRAALTPIPASNTPQPQIGFWERFVTSLQAWLRPPARLANVLALLLLLLLNITWLVQNSELRRQQLLLAAENAELRQQQMELTEQLNEQIDAQYYLTAKVDRQSEAMLLLASESVQRLELAAAQENSPAHASVVWSPEADIAVLYAESFPPLPEDKAYQLWLRKGESREDGGVFTVADDGTGIYIFETSDNLDQFDALGITDEPAGGSPEPTGEAVVRFRRQ